MNVLESCYVTSRMMDNSTPGESVLLCLKGLKQQGVYSAAISRLFFLNKTENMFKKDV